MATKSLYQKQICNKVDDSGTFFSAGIPTKEAKIHLSPTVNTSHFGWLFIGDPATQQTFFKFIHRSSHSLKLAQHIICNSFHAIEQYTFDLSPQTLPIGPLDVQSDGNFWPQDSNCLTWLEQQPTSSVIYIAFGSITVFNPHQFQELAHGLVLCGRPFLWVVRSDPTDGSTPPYPDGFLERVADRGLVVGWSPQQNVLAHPSVACFITHCGWNSTVEGLVNGVPMLCWPYFADQFLNQVYVSDVWRVRLKMDPDGDGIIPRGEIKKKVEDLLGDEGVKARVLELKEMAKKSVTEGGSSSKVFKDFVRVI
ncbi:UDP-glycosyltransferase 83A1 [Cinnamomum micranthum f. kanehirae]|uniref:UDP-glycosyltransferase 83A1 n=1 Tax=Cinnamomum micranthum f. kanehirae TaxID=337451 RepID=A0A3S3M444_9MAGN|nr:UDP-glycosyltransferase 83A1 [Cinnamomum micranthum f. kanehirae]